MNNPVEYIANNKIVEILIRDYMVDYCFRDDLTQEIYLILLQYNQSKLQQLIDKGQIKFFVARIIHNQFFSTTSTFYRQYKKPLLNKETLKQIIDNENGNETEEE